MFQLVIAIGAFAVSFASMYFISQVGGQYMSISVALGICVLWIVGKGVIRTMESSSCKGGRPVNRMQIAKVTLFIVSIGFAGRVIMRTVPDAYGSHL
jgi:hypothetical protein